MSALRPDETRIFERARAKINLTLHVGPPRGDGYHPLSSLVVFADVGDELTLSPSDQWTLSIDGPFAKGLEADETNLILKAAEWAQAKWGAQPGHFHLIKNLPVASGIGGGSADAAAALRTLVRRDGIDISEFTGTEGLGADIPVCLQSKTAMMSGIGERLDFIHAVDPLCAVLVNPGKSVSTGAIFKAYDQTDPQPLASISELLQDLLSAALIGRNDLESIAAKICPDITRVLERLKQDKRVKLARMSGSGATCFAILETMEAARALAKTFKAEHKDWWVKPTRLGHI